jgi:hypothetical protein
MNSLAILSAINGSQQLKDLVPNTQAIADALSLGRTRLTEKMISSRGVRVLLGPVNGSKFLRMLAETLGNATPSWLTMVLTSLGIPVDDHVYYADTFADGYRWLQTEDGLDIGNASVQELLDLMAAANPSLASAIMELKNSARVPEVVSEYDVRAAIYNDDGTLKV